MKDRATAAATSPTGASESESQAIWYRRPFRLAAPVSQGMTRCRAGSIAHCSPLIPRAVTSDGGVPS